MPVAYTDPFGLLVVFGNEESQTAYQNWKHRLTNASRSGNRWVAGSAQALLRRLGNLERARAIIRVTLGRISTNLPSSCQKNYACTETNPSSLHSEVRIDPVRGPASSGAGIEVMLAHELGHAYSNSIDETARMTSKVGRNFLSNESALDLENLERDVKVCGHRNEHDPGWFGSIPACNH